MSSTRLLKLFAGFYASGIPANGVYQSYTYLRDCPGSTTSDYDHLTANFWIGLKEGYKWPYLVYQRVTDPDQ